MRLLTHNAYNPWSEFDRIFAGSWKDGGWVPQFDVEETDSAWILRGDVPGLTQKDIEVRVDDDVLSVRGERKPAESEARFNRRERLYGKFERAFRLPENVAGSEAKASYQNGVLELTLPKREPVDTSRLIPVN